MLVLKLQPVSSGVSAFAVSMGEAAKPFDVQSVEVSKLEDIRHARFEASTCLVWSLWFGRV